MRTLEWVLRVGLFGEFLGHGYFAFAQSPNFVTLITNSTGLPDETALTLLRLIGSVDFVVAFLAIAYPFRALAIYAAMWGMLTGLSRPLSGMHLMDFVERWPNWAVPLALFFVLQLRVQRAKADAALPTSGLAVPRQQTVVAND